MQEEIIPKIETTEIEAYKGDVAGLQSMAASFVIKSQEDLEKGTDLLHAVKTAEKKIMERKEEITRPLMRALASARDLFKPFEVGFQEANKTIKVKMAAYLAEEELRIAEERARVLRRAEKGTIRQDTAIKKLENLNGVPTGAEGVKGKIQIRNVSKIRVVDETLIPREYMVPDITKIAEAVLRQGVEIPGVEKYTEKIIAGK